MNFIFQIATQSSYIWVWNFMYDSSIISYFIYLSDEILN
jgi:ABC-type multidrug transport system permease subunit